jgi:hypothetical protein
MAITSEYLPTPKEQRAIDEAVALLTATLNPLLVYGEYRTSDKAWCLQLVRHAPLEVPATVVLQGWPKPEYAGGTTK